MLQEQNKGLSPDMKFGITVVINMFNEGLYRNCRETSKKRLLPPIFLLILAEFHIMILDSI